MTSRTNTKKRNSLKHSPGFTFLEVIIVMVIIGILSAIATPLFLKWLPNYRLKGAVMDLHGQLQQARLIAVKNSSNAKVVFDKNSKTYFLDSNGNGTYDTNISGDVSFDLDDYGSGVNYGTMDGLNTNWNGNAINSPITFSDDFVTFSPRGTASSGSIYLRNEDNETTYAITVQSSGALKIRRYLNGKWK